jgi:hypothetical protein
MRLGFLTAAALVLGLSSGVLEVDAQVEVRQARPEETRLPGQANEIEPPMLLDVPLVGDGQHKPHIVDLIPNMSRVIRDTAAYKCRGITVTGILLRKTKPSRKGAMKLVVMPMLMTDNRRDSVDIQVSLINGDRVVATARDEVTVGLTAGQVITGGVFAIANPDRNASKEFTFDFESEEEFRRQLGGDGALLRVVVTPLE